MEKVEALVALGALAQETRLDIYRLLVQTGPDGMPAGHIGDQLGLPSATLAFHLKELKHAGLVTFTRNGRSLIYAAKYPTITRCYRTSPRTAAVAAWTNVCPRFRPMPP